MYSSTKTNIVNGGSYVFVERRVFMNSFSVVPLYVEFVRPRDIPPIKVAEL